MANPEIIPIWQPQGCSTYKITKDVAIKFGKKTTHTGVLDPMAEGVIIVLVGDARFEKQVYSNGHKVYEFDVVFGIETDSFDGMGIIVGKEFDTKPSRTNLGEKLRSLVGNYTQTVPLYSAQKVEGKELFMYPRLGLSTPILPTKSGIIYELAIVSEAQIIVKDLVTELIQKIKNIKIGEFRQAEIINGWEMLLRELDNGNTFPNLTRATFRVETSRGLYVRSLAQDICKLAGVIGFVSRLVRLKNGDYSKTDCCTLEEVC